MSLWKFNKKMEEITAVTTSQHTRGLGVNMYDNTIPSTVKLKQPIGYIRPQGAAAVQPACSPLQNHRDR